MVDLFRSREKSVRIVLGVLLGLVALSMLVYLVPGGFGGAAAGGQDTIAVVGDEKITTVDVQRAMEAVTRNQPNLPKGLMAMYLPSLINQLVEQKAMAYQARQIGLRVSDDELGDTIQSEFSQELGGKFDPNIYQRAVENQGMTVPAFEQQQREMMLSRRLEALEQQAIVVSDQDARAEYARRNDKVGLEYIAFADKDFAPKVNKDPAAVKAYFDKNRTLFRTPEKRDVTLLLGSTADFLANVKIGDDQLRREYQENRESYQIPERVKVRHILIKTQGLPKEQVPKLKAKAADILKQLQTGADFAELAKKNSDDPGSAQKGGELGWIAHGQTVANFDKTAFALNPGQLSGVIETEYGYHILQVEDKQTAHTQTFDEVKPQLEANLRRETASDDLKKAVDQAHAEIVRNPSQAGAIAKKYNLRVSDLKGFESNGTLPDISSPNLVNAIFSAAKASVTDVTSLDSEGKGAFAVVNNIVPNHNADFSEVEADATQKYVDAQSKALAQNAANDAAARARKGEPLAAIAKSFGLEVKTAAPFTIDGAAEGIGSASLLQAAFKDKVGDVVGPVSAQTGEFVCKVAQKVPSDLSQFSKNRDALVQSLQQQRAQVQGALFRDSVLQELKRRGKIKYHQDTITRLESSYQS
jgi:peptidyl-prolyl cis-trans isomerase D